MDRAPGRRQLVPYLLIAAGALILLSNAGWFDFGGFMAFLVSLVQLWPVALIAVGVDLLTQGRYRLWVVSGALVAAAGLLAFQGGLGWSGSARLADAQQVAVPLGLAAQASLVIDVEVGSLSLDTAAVGGLVIGGTVRPARGERLEQSAETRAGVTAVRLRGYTDGFLSRIWRQGGEWDLSLSRGMPVQLDISGGVGEIDVDLRAAHLLGLSLDSGVGSVLLVLPEDGDYTARINSGVGAVTVRIPEGAPVRVTVSSGLGGADVSGLRSVQDNVYVSPNYVFDQGAEIYVSGGVGRVSVQSVP